MRYQCSKFVQIGTLGFPFYYEAQIVGWSSFPALGMSKGLCRLWDCRELQEIIKGRPPQETQSEAWRSLPSDTLYCQECPVVTSSLAFLYFGL